MGEPLSSPGQEDPASPPTAARFEALLQKVQQYRPHDDLELLRRAYQFSARQHHAQTRASGEPYLSHPLEVTHPLAEMRLDVTTLCGGLLPDVVEDTRGDLPARTELFGPQGWR